MKIHQERWYTRTIIEDDALISVLDSGFSNDQLSFEWIKHFEVHSAKPQTGTHRLLLLDGYGSHFTFEFLDHCERHNFVSFCLPPPMQRIFSSHWTSLFSGLISIGMLRLLMLLLVWDAWISTSWNFSKLLDQLARRHRSLQPFSLCSERLVSSPTGPRRWLANYERKRRKEREIQSYDDQPPLQHRHSLQSQSLRHHSQSVH